MAIGIGEISPIKLQLTRENFNALIGRHSQPIRWLVAEKCSCVKDNRKIDANCPICFGKGVSYDTPTQSIRIESFTAPIDGVLEVTNAIWVKDFTGEEYIIEKTDCVTYVTGVKKGNSYQVKYVEDVSLTSAGVAEYIADKLYKINIPTETKFDVVQGELLSVTASFNSTPLTVKNLFRNCFEIEEEILATDQVIVSYSYVNPFKFALLNNNFPKVDQKFLTEVSGRGILIFPQRWEISKYDTIIALNATQIEKKVFKSTGDIDNLPSFYLNELKSASTIREAVKVEFIPNVDFILYKGNKIKWIGNKPEPLETISITYTSNIVYKLMKEQPAPRTSEDNRFPRKAYIETYTDFNKREAF